VKIFQLGRTIVVFILTALVLNACELQEVYVEDIRYIEFTHLSFSRVGLKVHIPIRNPNNISFRVTDIDMDVLINGLEVGRIINSDDVKILKNSDEVYPFPVDVSMTGVVKGALALLSLAGKDSAVIRLEGDLVVKYPFGKKTFKVAAENEVQIL